MEKQLFVEMALKAWNVQISRTDKFLASLQDELLTREIAPGKNRILYLMGHLIAVNDNMISLFSLGNRSYAHLDEAFIKNADRTIKAIPDVATLRADWKKSNAQLDSLFSKMTPEDWFSKHTAMTDEDFAKEPGRNKLSVLLNRTSHVAYHLGQMILADTK